MDIVFLFGFWNVLKLDCSYICTTLNILKFFWTVHFKQVNFIICEIFLDKNCKKCEVENLAVVLREEKSWKILKTKRTSIWKPSNGFKSIGIILPKFYE